MVVDLLWIDTMLLSSIESVHRMLVDIEKTPPGLDYFEILREKSFQLCILFTGFLMFSPYTETNDC